MTLSQRPGARFFAAFYQWSRYTQSPNPRPYIARYRLNTVDACADLCTSRNFSYARLRRQQSSVNTEVTPVVEKNDSSLLDRQEEDGQKFKDACLEGLTLEGVGTGVQKVDTTEETCMRDRAILQEQERLHGRSDINGGSHTCPDTAIPKLIEQQEQELDENATPAALQQSVRQIMRHVPSSVAVITAACVDPESNSQVPLGIAVSSLSTVTLDPPTISFNVRYPSRALDAIRAANGRFRVHFLDSDPRGAAIADLFTKGNNPQAFLNRQQAARITLPTSPFPPRILDTAVVAALECKVSQEFTVADHIIIVAKVSDTRGQNTTKSTLSYVQGGYVQKDRAIPRIRKKANSSTKSADHIKSHPFFSLPLFPGEPERDTFIERINSYLEVNPQVFRHSLGQTNAQVRHNLNIRGSTIGVSLRQVIAKAASQKGHRLEMEPWERDLPIKFKFYGPLSPSDISSIADHVKQLVQRDLTYRSVHQEKLFLLLGIDPLSTGMLASDILDSLRAHKLIPPFNYEKSYIVGGKVGTQWARQNVIPNLEQLEWVEYQLRQYLQTIDYASATRLSAEDLAQNAIGKLRWVKDYIGLIQARLYVEAFPSQFDASNIVISGQLSKQEIRVVLRRIFSFLARDRYHNIKDNLAIPWYEILRRVHVHPLVLGIDIELLYNKLKYILSFGSDQRKITEYMSFLENPWFKRQVDMKELEALTKKFAKASPAQAIAWDRKDWLAAMGLSHNARVLLDPATSDFTSLVTGHVLPRLMNAALEKRSGVGKEREMKPVVEYLQHYNQRNFTFMSEIRAQELRSEPRRPPVALRYDDLMSEEPRSLSVIRKHAAAQLLSSEQQQVAESIKNQMAKRRPMSNLEHKHLNFADELLDLAGKSHGYKAYGLDGERKN